MSEKSKTIFKLLWRIASISMSVLAIVFLIWFFFVK